MHCAGRSVLVLKNGSPSRCAEGLDPMTRSRDHIAAFRLVTEALSMDPLAVPVMRSQRVIVGRICDALSDPTRHDDDASTPDLCRLLMQAGESNPAVHLAMARYHLVHDKALEAMQLVDAVTTLNPCCREAWLLKAKVASRLNDPRLAARALAEAAVLDEEPVAFGPDPVAQC
jgi:hypothetical protein